MTLTRSETDTTCTPTVVSSLASQYMTISDYTKPIIVEMDLQVTFNSGTNSAVVSIRYGGILKASYTPKTLGLVSGEWVHVKLKVTDETLTAIVDGAEKPAVSHDGVFNRFYLTIPASSAWLIEYKNFIIYPE